MRLSFVSIIFSVLNPYSHQSFQATERFLFRVFTVQQRSALISYEMLLVCLGSLRNQKKILIECRKVQVDPNSFNVRFIIVNDSPLSFAHKKKLSDRILQSKRQVDHTYWCIRQAYWNLCRNFTGKLCSTVFHLAQSTAHRHSFTHRRRLVNKFQFSLY